MMMSTAEPSNAVYTRIPATFVVFAMSRPPTTYTSFGHFTLMRSPRGPSTLLSRHASTTASANRYWMNTRRVGGSSAKVTRRRRENWRQPFGETQELPLRPRPASWCVPTDKTGDGKRLRNFGFLDKYELGGE